MPFVLKTLKAQLRKEKQSVVSLYPDRKCIPQPRTKVARVTATGNTYNVVKEDNNKTEPVWSLLMKALNGEGRPLQTTPPPKKTTTTTEIPVWLQLLKRLQAEQQKRSMTTTTTVAVPTTEDWFGILKGMIQAVKGDGPTTLPTVKTKSTAWPQTSMYSEAAEERSTADPATLVISSVASEETVSLNNLTLPVYIETTTEASQTTLTDYTLDPKDKDNEFDIGVKTNKTVGVDASKIAEHNGSVLPKTTPNVVETSTIWHPSNSTIKDGTVHSPDSKIGNHANETKFKKPMTETPSWILEGKLLNDTARQVSNRDSIPQENNTNTVYRATDNIIQTYLGMNDAGATYDTIETIEETTAEMIGNENVTGIPVKLQNDDTATGRTINFGVFPPISDDLNPSKTYLTRKQNVSKKANKITTANAVKKIRNETQNDTHEKPRTTINSGKPFVEDNFTETSITAGEINSLSLDNKLKRMKMNDPLQEKDSLTFDKDRVSSVTTTERIIVGKLIGKGIGQNLSVDSGMTIFPPTELTTTEVEIYSLLNSLRKTLNDTRKLMMEATGTASSVKEIPDMKDSVRSSNFFNSFEPEVLGALKHGLLTDFQSGIVFRNVTANDTRNVKPIERTTYDSHIEHNTTETAHVVSRNKMLEHENSSFPFKHSFDIKTHNMATEESTSKTISSKPMTTPLMTIEQPLNATDKTLNSIVKLLVVNNSLVNEISENSSRIAVTDIPKSETTMQTIAETVGDGTESQLNGKMNFSRDDTSTDILHSIITSREQMTDTDSNSSSAVQVTSSSMLSTLKESVDFLSTTSKIYNVTEPLRKDNVNSSSQSFGKGEEKTSLLKQHFTTTQSEYDVLLKEVRRALNRTKDRIENIDAQLQMIENPIENTSLNYETRSEAIPTSEDLFKYGLLTDSQSNDVSSNPTSNEMAGDKLILNEVRDGTTVTASIKTNLNIGLLDNKPSTVTPPPWSYDTTTFPLVNFWDTITTQSTLLDSVWSPVPSNTIWSSLFDTLNFGTLGMATTSKSRDSLQQHFHVTESSKAIKVRYETPTTKGPIRTLETEPIMANANQIPIVRIQEINRNDLATTMDSNIISTPYVVKYDSTTPPNGLASTAASNIVTTPFVAVKYDSTTPPNDLASTTASNIVTTPFVAVKYDSTTRPNSLASTAASNIVTTPFVAVKNDSTTPPNDLASTTASNIVTTPFVTVKYDSTTRPNDLASTAASNIVSTPYLGDSSNITSNIREMFETSSKELATDANRKGEETPIKPVQTTSEKATTDSKVVFTRPLVDFLSTTPITPRSSSSTNKESGIRTTTTRITTPEPISYSEVNNITTTDHTSPRSHIKKDKTLKTSEPISYSEVNNITATDHTSPRSNIKDIKEDKTLKTSEPISYSEVNNITTTNHTLPPFNIKEDKTLHTSDPISYLEVNDIITTDHTSPQSHIKEDNTLKKSEPISYSEVNNITKTDHISPRSNIKEDNTIKTSEPIPYSDVNNITTTDHTSPRSNIKEDRTLKTSDPISYSEVNNITTTDHTLPRSNITEGNTLKNSNQSSYSRVPIQILASSPKRGNSLGVYRNNEPKNSNSNVERSLQEVNRTQDIHTSNSEVIKNKIRDGTSTIIVNLPTRGKNIMTENWWDKFKPTTWFSFETQYKTSTENPWQDRLSSREITTPPTTAASGNGCILLQDAAGIVALQYL